MIRTRIIPAVMAAAIVVPGMALPGAALAAEEAHIEDVSFSYEGPFGTYDRLQLQRGFQVFQEVCAACHGLQYLSFRELRGATGPAFPEEQVKAIAALYEVYDPELEDTRPAKPFDMFPANTDAGAPDPAAASSARIHRHPAPAHRPRPRMETDPMSVLPTDTEPTGTPSAQFVTQ